MSCGCKIMKAGYLDRHRTLLAVSKVRLNIEVPVSERGVAVFVLCMHVPRPYSAPRMVLLAALRTE